MTAADIPAGIRLCRAARWNQLEDDWRMFIEPPSSAWMVEDGHAAIGTSAVAQYDNLAWIAMMLVDPAQRRAGHGSRLLTAAMDATANAPCVGLDATPAGEPLYRKFGFVESYTLVRMTRAPLGSDVKRMRLTEPRPLGSGAPVFALDREVFGADRSRLLASFLSRAPESAWMLDGGYCFGRAGHLYHQIGPVVSSDLETACALVTACVTDRDMVIDVPFQHTAFLDWLTTIGFREERRLLRMFLRGHHHPGDPSRQYAIAGPEFA
jgi:GNAT superfamily N-acetyltransferase